ncbi:MAG: hypothetical protein WC683_03135 [bacterium]
MFAATRGKLPEDQVRLHQVAFDQWEAVDAAPQTPVRGEAGREASALALAAVSGHESGFWSKVQDCSACFVGSQYCDRGMSISLFQLRTGSGAFGDYTREQLCESNALATERALVLLNRHRRAHTTLALFKGYARGGRSGAAEEMDAMYATALRKAGIVVTYGTTVDAEGKEHRGLKAAWLPGRKPVPGEPEAAMPTLPRLDIRLPDPLRIGAWNSEAGRPTYQLRFLAHPGT